MIECYKVNCETIEELRRAKVLELSWSMLSEDDKIFLFKNMGVLCAALRMSEHPYENKICIDEFEVVKGFRNKGLGRYIICEILRAYGRVFSLSVKNESVAEFWNKCGFEREDILSDEILMHYTPYNLAKEH